MNSTMFRKRASLKHFCKRGRLEKFACHQRLQKTGSIGDSTNDQAVKDPARMVVLDVPHLHVIEIC